MSPPSIGVTKVVFTRWTMSWVIRSPSCSASRISRASPASSGQVSSISLSSRAARTVFCPAWVKRSKKTRSLGTREGSGMGAKLAVGEDLSDPPRRLTVPFLRWLGADGGSASQQLGYLGDPRGREPEQRVGAGPDRYRPLGVVAEREARDPEVGGFLLDPAGVGEYCPGVGLEREEVQVSGGVRERQPRRRPLAEHLSGPRVDREDDRHRGRDALQRDDRVAEQRAVDERRPVQGDEQVGARLDAERAGGATVAKPVLEGDQRVDHRVADEAVAGLLDALGAQVVLGLGAVQKEQLREMVGDDPVDLLGHRPIEAAEPGFDVPDRDLKARCAERGGEGRVDVAGNEHEIGPRLAQYGLEPREHARGLL